MQRALCTLRNLDEVTGFRDFRREVATAEAALGAPLHDDLLAIYVARPGGYVELLGVTLDKLVPLTAARSAGCAPELLAIGYHDGGSEYVCVSSQAARDEPLQVQLFRPDNDAREMMSLAAWLEHLVEVSMEYLHARNPDDTRSSDELVATPEQCAALADAVKRVRAPVLERWAHHPKLGRVRVVDETGEGADRKLTVELADGARKTLLARFLTGD